MKYKMTSKLQPNNLLQRSLQLLNGHFLVEDVSVPLPAVGLQLVIVVAGILEIKRVATNLSRAPQQDEF